ncbi:hypothetical protein DFH06DRAFT_1200693 [Mycena polygramma]|nr:hypothetical protein DFH06DRAFT_1200693 [Mycena polygramma]
MSASEAPVLLGRICSAWRVISLSTPRLWARLHVAAPTFFRDWTDEALFQRKVAQRLEITKTWLGRSGNCSLSISVEGPAGSSHTARFLEALTPFVSRWQNIAFTVPLSTLQIISDLEAQAPALETVTFDHHSHGRTGPADREWGPFWILGGARIRSFSIPGTTFLPERFPLRWNQLTTLSIGGPGWAVSKALKSETILRTISCCSELRCCKLLVIDTDPSPGPNVTLRPVIELPFLHTLDLRCASYVIPAVTLLLGRLSLPRLHDFTFCGPKGHRDQESPSLTDFFMRTTCLEILDIDCSIFSKSSLLENLRVFPSTIRRLAVRDLPAGRESQRGFGDDALSVLTPASQPGTFVCPALRHFSIKHTCVSDEALLRFITARMNSPRTLTHVACNFDRRVTVNILPSLEQFIQTGLDVSLNYIEPPPAQFSPWQGLPDAPMTVWRAPSPLH